MYKADLVFKALIAFNGWQFMNVALQAMPPDRNLPFRFWARRSFVGQAMSFQNQGDRPAIGERKSRLQTKCDANRAVIWVLFSIFDHRHFIFRRDDSFLPFTGNFIERRMAINPLSDRIAMNGKAATPVR